jgi:hypothetical protein
MGNQFYFLFISVVALLGVMTLIAYFLSRDAYKTALGSLLSSITLMVGGLSLPELKGPVDIALDLSPFFVVKSQGFEVLVGSPTLIWMTAFISVAILTALFGFYYHIEMKDKRRYPVP